MEAGVTVLMTWVMGELGGWGQHAHIRTLAEDVSAPLHIELRTRRPLVWRANWATSCPSHLCMLCVSIGAPVLSTEVLSRPTTSKVAREAACLLHPEPNITLPGQPSYPPTHSPAP